MEPSTSCRPVPTAAGSVYSRGCKSLGVTYAAQRLTGLAEISRRPHAQHRQAYAEDRTGLGTGTAVPVCRVHPASQKWPAERTAARPLTSQSVAVCICDETRPEVWWPIYVVNAESTRTTNAERRRFFLLCMCVCVCVLCMCVCLCLCLCLCVCVRVRVHSSETAELTPKLRA